MSSGLVGVGIIGSGFMGRTHAEVIAKYAKEARLVAATGGARAPALARDYGMALEPDVKGLLARKDVDAVFINTPQAVHLEQALAAAEAGKHMLVEKPMAVTVADCDRILEACRRARVNCSIGFTQRFRACNIKAKRLIDEGRIGKVLQVRESMLLTGGLKGLPAWQSEPANLGTLIGYGVHNIDRLRWLTGSEVRTVFAKCGSLDPSAAAEGTSLLVMTTTGGVVAGFWCSYQIPAPGFPKSAFQSWVVGEKGLLDLDAYGELKLGVGEGWETVETQEPIDWKGKGAFDPVRLASYAAQNQDFIDSIREGRPPAITGWDGRQAVAIALAAYESSRSGREMTL